MGTVVSLNRDRLWVDVVAFERTLGDAEAAVGAGNEDLIQRAIDYYHGSFLSDDTDEPWTVSLPERLRSTFIAALSGLAVLLVAGFMVAQQYRRDHPEERMTEWLDSHHMGWLHRRKH